MATEPGRREKRLVAETENFKGLLDVEPDPRTQTFRGALRPLILALEAAGWERAQRGARWWSLRFIWPDSGSPPALLAPEPDEMPDRDTMNER